MTLEHRKQLDDLLIAELNVKNIARRICTTEKGDIVLNYDGDTREYDVLLNKEKLPRKALYEKLMEGLLKDHESIS